MEFDPGMTGKGVLIIMTHDVIAQKLFIVKKNVGFAKHSKHNFHWSHFSPGLQHGLDTEICFPNFFFFFFLIWQTFPSDAVVLSVQVVHTEL